jgi:DNA repair protein RadD
LILNQYLPNKELYSSFTDEKNFEDVEFILKNMLEDEDRINSIYAEKELLGQIHHATHLDEYMHKSFRKELYECSSTILAPTWKNFFKQCKSLNIAETVEFEWGNNAETKNFVEFFKYPNYLVPNENFIFRTEEIITPGEKFEPLKSLHSYQMPIVSKTLKKLKNFNSRCLIQMPTGTGKTRTAMEIVCRLFNENKDQQIVWFADRTELLDQASLEFIHVWNHLGKFPIKIIRAYGSAPITNIPEKGAIIFASYQKLNNLMRKKEKIKPHYVVVDEAHRIIAPKFNKALQSTCDLERATRVIGLTATPGRGLDEVQNRALVLEFHNEIIGIELSGEDREMYENNIIRYLEEGEEVLSKAILNPIETDIPYALNDEEYDELTKYADGDKKEATKLLKRLATDNTRNIIIIDKLQELAKEGKKILYFSTDLTQSIIVFAALQKLGVNAVHVDGTTDKSFRREIIQKFKTTNEINVICNFDIFSTGFDVQKLDVVFIARPVNSQVLFNQMVGRGTRGPRVGGTETFSLIQIIDKIKYSRFIGFDPYEQYGIWDKNWIKQNED